MPSATMPPARPLLLLLAFALTWPAEEAVTVEATAGTAISVVGDSGWCEMTVEQLEEYEGACTLAALNETFPNCVGVGETQPSLWVAWCELYNHTNTAPVVEEVCADAVLEHLDDSNFSVGTFDACSESTSVQHACEREQTEACAAALVCRLRLSHLAIQPGVYVCSEDQADLVEEWCLEVFSPCPAETPDATQKWWRKEQVALLVITTCLVLVTICFEFIKDFLEEVFSKDWHPLLQHLFGELTVLGFVGLLVFIIQSNANGLLSTISESLFYEEPPPGRAKPLECDAERREARANLTELTEVVHMILFFVMTMFLLEIGAIYKLASTIVSRWHRYERDHGHETLLIKERAYVQLLRRRSWSAWLSPSLFLRGRDLDRKALYVSLRNGFCHPPPKTVRMHSQKIARMCGEGKSAAAAEFKRLDRALRKQELHSSVANGADGANGVLGDSGGVPLLRADPHESISSTTYGSTFAFDEYLKLVLQKHMVTLVGFGNATWVTLYVGFVVFWTILWFAKDWGPVAVCAAMIASMWAALIALFAIVRKLSTTCWKLVPLHLVAITNQELDEVIRHIEHHFHPWGNRKSPVPAQPVMRHKTVYEGDPDAEKVPLLRSASSPVVGAAETFAGKSIDLGHSLHAPHVSDFFARWRSEMHLHHPEIRQKIRGTAVLPRNRVEYEMLEQKDEASGKHVHPDYNLMPEYHRMPPVTQPKHRLHRLWNGLYRRTDKLDRHSRLLWGGCNGPTYLTWVFRFTVLWTSIYVAVFVKVFGPQLIFARDSFEDVSIAYRCATLVLAILPVPLMFFPLLRDAVSLYVMVCNVELMKDAAVVTRVFQYQRGTHAMTVLKALTRIKRNEKLREHIKQRAGRRASTVVPADWDDEAADFPMPLRKASIRRAGRMRKRLASGASVFSVSSAGSGAISLRMPGIQNEERAPSAAAAPAESPGMFLEGRPSSVDTEDASDAALQAEFRDMFHTYTKMYNRSSTLRRQEIAVLLTRFHILEEEDEDNVDLMTQSGGLDFKRAGAQIIKETQCEDTHMHRISPDEVWDALTSDTRREVSVIMDEMDSFESASGEKVVNEDGFVEWMVHSTKDSDELSTNELIELMWSGIDADGSGTVTSEELFEELYSIVGDDIAREDVNALIRYVDKDGTGDLSKAEFLDLLKEMDEVM